MSLDSAYHMLVIRPLSVANLEPVYQQLNFCHGIGSLTNLEELLLYWNKGLDTLPERIGGLNHLKKLHLCECNITEIPER